jgi:subtilisin family serine protease
MKKTAILSVLAILAAATGLATTALADSLVGYMPGRLLLDLEPGFTPTVEKRVDGLSVDDPGLQGVVDRYGGVGLAPLHPYLKHAEKAAAEPLRRQWIVEFDAAADLDEVAAACAALPGVAKVWKDEIRKLHAAVPDDPDLDLQWYLRNEVYGRKDVRWLGGLAETSGDSNVVIAIIDSGVDWQHPDLGGTNADHTDGCIWMNWDEYFGTPGVDDDGNYYVDDMRGWDFVTNSTSPWPGEDATGADNDPMDFGGHGTGCAGCAAAVTNNGVGISGTAPGCKIMALRAGWLQSAGGQPQGVVSMAFASLAIRYAADNGGDIINCSWGSSSYLYSSLNYAVSAGLIICNAAGNDSDTIPEYLDTYSGSISVAALNEFDQKASFSNWGSWVECAAPGDNIYTTYFDYATGTSTYDQVDGTSFASPITAGVIAMLWSANPGLNRTQIMNLLYDTCDDVDYANPGIPGLLGAGRPNLLTALGDSFHQVPDEFEDMFDAVNECAAGDTIAMPSSHVVGSVMMIYDKEISYLGGWDDTYTTRDPENDPTVVNGSTATPAMVVNPGAGAAVVVDGFRLTGGTGMHFSSIPYTGKYGGGLVVLGDATLRNLDVTGNTTGNIIEEGGGGGVLLMNSSAVMENCTIHDNSSVYGWGVYVYNGAPTLSGCRIYDNFTNDNFIYYPLGGGVYVHGGDLTLDGCVVSGHDGLLDGGGLYLSETSASTLIGNTFVANEATGSGAGLYALNATATLENNIVAFNTGNGVEGSSATLTFNCNDVYGNTAEYVGLTDPTGSDGNVSEDPRFCDFDLEVYTISDASPCHPDNSGGCGQIGALGEGCTEGNAVEDGEAPLRFAVQPNYPNPFNPKTTIRFALPEAAATTLRVYDVAGRLVRTLLAHQLPAAEHAIDWHGDDEEGRRVPAGVYFYRLQAGPYLHVGQMALIK